MLHIGYATPPDLCNPHTCGTSGRPQARYCTPTACITTFPASTLFRHGRQGAQLCSTAVWFDRIGIIPEANWRTTAFWSDYRPAAQWGVLQVPRSPQGSRVWAKFGRDCPTRANIGRIGQRSVESVPHSADPGPDLAACSPDIWPSEKHLCPKSEIDLPEVCRVRPKFGCQCRATLGNNCKKLAAFGPTPVDLIWPIALLDEYGFPIPRVPCPAEEPRPPVSSCPGFLMPDKVEATRGG